MQCGAHSRKSAIGLFRDISDSAGTWLPGVSCPRLELGYSTGMTAGGALSKTNFEDQRQR